MKFRWETEFKETEVGEIPKDWNFEPLGNQDKFEIRMGQSPPSKFYNSVGLGVPFIQGRGDFGELYVDPKTYTTNCSKIALPNSVLITVRAPVGELNLTKDKICIGRGVASINSKNNDVLLNRFIFYSLTALKSHVAMFGERGTTYDAITKEELNNIKIPYPPLPEQNRIATVLSWFDDLIENKKRQNEILEKIAMAIFKNWFIDFEPFKDEEFVYNEELGKEIPKGWEVKPIGEIAEFINGYSYKGSEKSIEGDSDSYIFVTLNNIREGGGFKPEYTWIKSERVKERHYVREGELIIANTEQTKTGRLLATPALVIFPWDYKKEFGVFSHHITKVSPKIDYYSIFLYLMFRLYQQNIAHSFHTGTGVWGFDLENFKNSYIILHPPTKILQSFHSLVEPLFQKILNNQKQIMLLKKIRDTLLPLLVFGKLRVEEL